MDTQSFIQTLLPKRSEIAALFAKPFDDGYILDIKSWFSEFIKYLSTIDISNINLNDPELLAISKDIKSFYDKFYIFDETHIALDILEGKSVPEFKSNNSTLADEEIKAMQIGSDSNVCFVGSGPYPWSIIKYSRAYGCTGTAIEGRPEAVTLSTELIKYFVLSDKIKVICSDANDVDYSSFDVIVLAAMVYPKSKLIENIYTKMKPGAKLLARSAIGQYGLIYDTLSPNDIPNNLKYTILKGENGCELETYFFQKE
ncbi:MAG: nicotianamine synthase family protein [Patescibacteria group bacterium]